MFCSYSLFKVLLVGDSEVGQALFIVDSNDQLLSKPVQLLDYTYSSLHISDCDLLTFLYDEKTNEQILLTPEQYIITIQQAEFTPRKFITCIINKDKTVISEPIQLSDIGIEIRHSIKNIISNRLNLFDGKRHKQSDDISIDQIEYKREQFNMDNFLNTMKSFLQLAEKLTKHGKTQTIGSIEIQKLENDLIQQLTQISI
ncbi:unnamed protein product [Rotaria sp. Silwood1]|nr:unnamed protein product [Rotaria sp. Silwood1]